MNTRRRIPLASILVLAFAFATQCVALESTARMQQIVRSYAAEDRFMGSVLVARGDSVILDEAYGFAALDGQLANLPDTGFRIGSISKQFTAACVLLLEEQGKLKLTDRVVK